MATSFSIQERDLDLHLPPADTVSFIPVNLRCMDGAVVEENPRDPLELAPAPLSAPSAQPWQLPDFPPGGDGFDVPHRADDLEVHRCKLSLVRPEPNSDLVLADLALDAGEVRVKVHAPKGPERPSEERRPDRTWQDLGHHGRVEDPSDDAVVRRGFRCCPVRPSAVDRSSWGG